MKLVEMFDEDGNLSQLQDENSKRLSAIKQALDSGRVITVIDAGSYPGKIAMGDLRELGYAHKEQGAQYSPTQYDEYWVIDGDITITLDGDDRVYNKGDSTEPVTVDRS